MLQTLNNPAGFKILFLINNRLPCQQLTTNNISRLLCRSSRLETKLSLKNEILKNLASKNTQRKINGVLGTYLQETLWGQEKPLQKTR